MKGDMEGDMRGGVLQEDTRWAPLLPPLYVLHLCIDALSNTWCEHLSEYLPAIKQEGGGGGQRWWHSGGAVVVAQWQSSGGPVMARWWPSDGTVMAPAQCSGIPLPTQHTQRGKMSKKKSHHQCCSKRERD